MKCSLIQQITVDTEGNMNFKCLKHQIHMWLDLGFLGLNIYFTTSSIFGPDNGSLFSLFIVYYLSSFCFGNRICIRKACRNLLQHIATWKRLKI